MGDTFHDPVDHVRTTRPHAGRAVINVAGWPGYSLLVVGMLAVAGCLVAFGTGNDRQGAEIAVLALLAAAIGTSWLLMEHRRINRIAERWQLTHPQLQGPPASQ